jgi:hypothetical protein
MIFAIADDRKSQNYALKRDTLYKMEHFVELPHDDSAPSRPTDFFRVGARVTQPRNYGKSYAGRSYQDAHSRLVTMSSR